MVFVKTARQKKIQRVKKFNKTVKNRGALINTICHALFRKKNDHEISENAIFSVFIKK